MLPSERIQNIACKFSEQKDYNAYIANWRNPYTSDYVDAIQSYLDEQYKIHQNEYNEIMERINKIEMLIYPKETYEDLKKYKIEENKIKTATDVYMEERNKN